MSCSQKLLLSGYWNEYGFPKAKQSANVVAVAVLPSPLDGLSVGELDALAAEGVFENKRGTHMIDQKWDGVIRHVLTAAGAVVVTLGFMDEATWMKVSGALLTLMPMVWSWMSKA